MYSATGVYPPPILISDSFSGDLSRFLNPSHIIVVFGSLTVSPNLIIARIAQTVPVSEDLFASFYVRPVPTTRVSSAQPIIIALLVPFTLNTL